MGFAEVFGLCMLCLAFTAFVSPPSLLILSKVSSLYLKAIISWPPSQISGDKLFSTSMENRLGHLLAEKLKRNPHLVGLFKQVLWTDKAVIVYHATNRYLAPLYPYFSEYDKSKAVVASAFIYQAYQSLNVALRVVNDPGKGRYVSHNSLRYSVNDRERASDSQIRVSSVSPPGDKY